ncbi:MAG: ribonuclease III [Caldithrix sp.]|nr:ribonuclease III [Caldithrix sp.]
MLKKIIQRIGFTSGSQDSGSLDYPAIEERINYTFSDKALLLRAFKHRSYLTITGEKTFESNERLEFLGDAVLDMIVTEHLYNYYAREDEGTLSKKKAILVSRKVLSRIISELELGQFLLLNRGEVKTGGKSRQSNLANLFEALLGAIYLDSNFKQAQIFVHNFLLERMDEFLNLRTYFNYKSSLLEYVQARGWKYPEYKVVEEEGPDHNKQFKVTVTVNNQFSAYGVGKSKKNAEQNAARYLMRKFTHSKDNPIYHESERQA